MNSMNSLNLYKPEDQCQYRLPAPLKRIKLYEGGLKEFIDNNSRFFQSEEPIDNHPIAFQSTFSEPDVSLKDKRINQLSSNFVNLYHYQYHFQSDPEDIIQYIDAHNAFWKTQASNFQVSNPVNPSLKRKRTSQLSSNALTLKTTTPSHKKNVSVYEWETKYFPIIKKTCESFSKTFKEILITKNKCSPIARAIYSTWESDKTNIEGEEITTLINQHKLQSKLYKCDKLKKLIYEIIPVPVLESNE